MGYSRGDLFFVCPTTARLAEPVLIGQVAARESYPPSARLGLSWFCNLIMAMREVKSTGCAGMNRNLKRFQGDRGCEVGM